jgi:hypothetical protein
MLGVTLIRLGFPTPSVFLLLPPLSGGLRCGHRRSLPRAPGSLPCPGQVPHGAWQTSRYGTNWPSTNRQYSARGSIHPIACFGRGCTPVAGLASRPGVCAAAHHDCLAATAISYALAAAEPARQAQPPGPGQKAPCAYPSHMAIQSDVGHPADRRRATHAGHRGSQIDRGEVSRAPAEAPIADVGDVSQKSHARPGRSGLLHGTHHDVSGALRPRDPGARARRVVHFNITEHPTAQWTAQQIVEAFPWAEIPWYRLRDRDGVYGAAFRQRVRNRGRVTDHGVCCPRPAEATVLAAGGCRECTLGGRGALWSLLGA